MKNSRPDGSDENDGSRERPLATIQSALSRSPSAHVFVLPGTYALTAPILLDAANSGAIVEAGGDEMPVFDGGRRLSGFRPASNGLWRAQADFRFE